METANKKFRYSIRKFKVGVGSVLIATCLLGAGISTSTAFAMTDSSTATETTKTPLQHLEELVKELKTDLEELKEFPEYDRSKYPLQKELWEENLRFGKNQMDLVSTLKEDNAGFSTIPQRLYDFRNHIKWERLTRQVDQYRKKYPDNARIEEEYKSHLEQTDGNNYASQEDVNLQASTNDAEQALERIQKIVQELEPKEEPAPEAPTPKEEPAPAPKEEDTPAPTPKVEDETQEPKTEEKAPETKEETPTPTPKEEGIPAPIPDAPAPKAEDEVPAPKEEETPAPKEEDTPAPDVAPAPTPEVDPAPTPIPDAPTPKVEEETQEPKTEEKAPETKEETPTPAPEAEAPKAEEEIPAPIPDAPAPTPEEPKTEEDAPTPAPAPETPMDEPKMEEPKSEMPAPKAEEEVPTPMPDAPAPKTEEDTPTPAPETPMDQPKMEEPKTDKVESDKQMPEAKQPEMEQPKAEDMPKEEMPKAEQPKAGDSAPKTAVPEVAPKTAEKPKLDFTTKERKVEEALPIKEEIRYDASLALGKSYLLQEGKAGKKVSVYQDVIVDGKVVATNLLSETVVEGQNRILVKGSLEMKKEEVKITPSVQSNPTLSHKGAPSANKATLPATGEQRNNLSLVGLGLAGISLAVVATAINKKSKDQI
ncbi:Surface protein from Gram-positive cocci%2C anchor region:YSIRK Gram-positive signal peptide [Streptococcus suis]|uniref:GAG-binding domain-containing protein n=1 Tax=Streptococcus suis TaxID=1307 RepID=UPI0005CF28ED|nr:GAG-binding domain-containing protein [Streptococcus suis]NQI10689.1 YSIRK-type signal peptide-containing protein [Streptococcus suis]CYU27044.1 Surface protein from Gram-positive cocci%2C anchor region:YSIRK Gram-positive signal peptide [Streptococcus suis]